MVEKGTIEAFWLQWRVLGAASGMSGCFGGWPSDLQLSSAGLVELLRFG